MAHIDIANIPSELKYLPQWVNWRIEIRNGKRTKVPYCAKTARKAKCEPVPKDGKEPTPEEYAAARATWADFETAVESIPKFDGIGFQLTVADPFAGVDLDDCVHGGVLEPWAQAIVDRLASYTEISPSGKGIRVFVKARIPGSRRRKGAVEIYDRARFLTVTGNRLCRTPATVENRQGELDDLYARIFVSEDSSPAPARATVPVDLADSEIIEKALASNDGFRRLWSGDVSGYQSQSEADLALCNHLAFWTGCDAERIDRLFRMSALYRPKWERAYYRERTLHKATQGVSDTYRLSAAPVNTQTVKPLPEPDKSIRTNQIADAITLRTYFARDVGDELYVYQDGTYSPHGRRYVRERVKEVLLDWGRPDQWSLYRAREVEGYILADATQLWDRPPVDIVNVRNGLLKVRTAELRAHSPDFLSTVQLPVSFDPKADCPAWDEFCREVFPEDCADTLPWELAALLMIPHTGLQKAILLLGERATGKSTFLAASQAFIGRENYSALSLHSLEANRFATSRLVGKLANICADLPASHLAGTSVFKGITGEDEIEAERKHQESFMFSPFCRLIFSANSPPQSPDSTDAFFARWVVVPFANSFADRAIPKDKLLARLTTRRELSGLLNRALLALPTVLERGITESASMREAAQEFREITDPITVWLNQACTELPDAFVAKGALLDAYNGDCRKNGRPVSNSTAFGIAVKRARQGVRDAQRTVGGKVVWCWTGIGMKDELH